MELGIDSELKESALFITSLLPDETEGRSVKRLVLRRNIDRDISNKRLVIHRCE